MEDHMEWVPHVTVATVVERNGKYLLVEELSNGKLVFNQPAGHLDANESLSEAAVRETVEETGWKVQIDGIVGIALYKSPHNQVTYHRTTFFGSAISHDPERQLDDGISRAIWMSYDEMQLAAAKMRSHLVLKAVEQYRNGHRYPVDVIYE
jgi:ADP-ribose pyrophosphatase YjhB (NUDIX family)